MTAVFVLVLAVAVAGCGSSSSGGGGKKEGSKGGTINIALQAPFTGDYGFFGEGYLRGVRTWIDQHGGAKIGNRPVTVMQVEDGCDVAKAVAAFRKNARKVVAVIGSACSAPVKAMTPLAKQYKIPTVFLAQSASLTQGYTDGWLFRATQPDTANIEAFGEYVLAKWQGQGITKLGVLHDTSVLDAAAPDQYGPIAEKHGMKIVNTGSFDLGETNFSSQVLKLKQSGAQAVIIATYGPETARIVKTMSDLGVKIPIATGTDTAYPSTIDAAGPDLNGAYFYTDYLSGSDNAGLKEFEAAFAKKYPKIQPQAIDYEAYLAMDALMTAMKEPGAADGGDALKNALHKVQLTYGDLNIGFLSNGDQKTVLTFIGQVRDGKTAVDQLLTQPRESFSDFK